MRPFSEYLYEGFFRDTKTRLVKGFVPRAVRQRIAAPVAAGRAMAETNPRKKANLAKLAKNYVRGSGKMPNYARSGWE